MSLRPALSSVPDVGFSLAWYDVSRYVQFQGPDYSLITASEL